MQVKQGSRVHQLKANTKPSSEQQSPYHSLQKSQGNTRNQSLQLEPHHEEGRMKKQLSRLRGKVSELQKENMDLQKLNIEQEAELSLWVQKARRLTQELRALEEKHLNVQFSSSSPDQFLRKQLRVLQEQAKNLAASKVAIEQELKAERQRLKAFQSRARQAEQDSIFAKQLQTKLADTEDLLQKTRSAYERSQVKATRNEMYVSQLETEIKALEQQLQKQITLLEQEKHSCIQELKGQLSLMQLKLNQQKQRNQELSNKIDDLYRANKKMSEQARSYRQKEQLESSKRQDLLREFQRLQSNYESLSKENQRLRQQQDIGSRTQRQSPTLQAQTIIQGYRQLQNLEAKLKQQHNTLIEQQAQSKQHKARMSQLQMMLKQQTVRISEQQLRIKEQQSKINDQSKVIREMGLEREKFTQQILKTDKDNNKYRHLNEQLSIRLLQLETSAKNQQQDIPIKRRLFKEANSLQALLQKSKEHNQSQIQPTEITLKHEIQMLERRLREQKMQAQHLAYELQKSQQKQIQLGNQLRDALVLKQQLVSLEEVNAQLLRRIRDQESIVAEMRAQNQRWKSYRLSEQDEARRQTRKYKKRVEELEQLLSKEKQESIKALEQAQIICNQLRIATVSKQSTHSLQLQQQKTVLTRAMDEMEAEFRNLLAECQYKLQNKQAQIDQKHQQIIRKQTQAYQKQQQNQRQQQLIDRQRQQILDKQRQIELLSVESREQKALARQYLLQKEAAQVLAQELDRQLAYAKAEVQKLHCTTKRESQSIRSTAIAEAQRQARTRYEKSIEDKVVEIQRLKLQISELQEESRRAISLKKQLQVSQNSLKELQREDLSKSDRLQYLQRMVESYESQIRSCKKAKEDLISQIRLLQRETKSRTELQQKNITLERELASEKSRQAKHAEEKARLQDEISRQQIVAREWRDKYQALLNQKDRSISNASTREKELKSQIKELQSLLDHKQNNIQRLQSQCDKFETQLKSAIQRQRLLRKEIEEEKTSQSVAQNTIKSFQKTIEQQKKLIQSLAFEQEDKVRQIQLLLEKLSQCEAESAQNAVKSLQGQQIKRAARLSGLQPLARLAGIALFEEQVAIKGIYDWAQRIASKTRQQQDEANQYRRLVVKLKEENQILSQKYLKYKTLALEYKERRDREKLLINNTYRFNDEILTHCQNIIKGATK